MDEQAMKEREEQELLISCGREVARSQLEKAATTAKNAMQLSNQVFLLRRSAIHILAVEFFNLEMEHEMPLDEYFTTLLNVLADEIEGVRKQKMIKHEVPEGKLPT